MKMSPTIGKLAEALCKAQSQMTHVTKDATNPFFKSRYATLDAVIEHTRVPLSSNGLSIVQATRMDAGQIILVSTLLHISGEWIASEYPVLPLKNDSQAVGSAMSYSRRYSIQALINIASAEDDDGQAAGQQAYVPKAPQVPQPTQAEKWKEQPKTEWMYRGTEEDKELVRKSLLNRGIRETKQIDDIFERIRGKTGAEVKVYLDSLGANS